MKAKNVPIVYLIDILIFYIGINILSSILWNVYSIYEKLCESSFELNMSKL